MNFLKINDFSKQDYLKLFEETDKLKKKMTDDLKGKTCVLYFEKPSTRTMMSFETGIYEMQGNSFRLTKEMSQLSRGETIHDTMKVISRYAHFFIGRVFSHEMLEEAAKYSSIPVINALSDKEHPCQAVADFYTIFKHNKQNGKIVWLGDGSNVCISNMYLAHILGCKMVFSGPKEFSPDTKILKETDTAYEEDPIKAVKDADVVMTDTWVSMGEEGKSEKPFEKYQVNEKLIKNAKKDYIFMHCLPAHRNHEVTDQVIDSKNSVVFEEAENRLHTQKAILKKLL